MENVYYKTIYKPKSVEHLGPPNAAEFDGTQAHMFCPVNDLILNIFHCTYGWSIMSYSFVHSIKRSVKHGLITQKNESENEFVNPEGAWGTASSLPGRVANITLYISP